MNITDPNLVIRLNCHKFWTENVKEQRKVIILTLVLMYVPYRTQNQYLTAQELIKYLNIEEEYIYDATISLIECLKDTIYRKIIKKLIGERAVDYIRDFRIIEIEGSFIESKYKVLFNDINADEHLNKLSQMCGK